MPVCAQPADLKGAKDAMAAGDYARAASLFTNVLQGERLEAPMLADVYYERGVAEHQLGSLTRAISDYTNAIWLGALAPGFEAKVFLARGIAQLEGNQINRAETDFDSAIAKDGNLADAYFARATVRRLQAELDAAIADYDKAIVLNHPAPQLVYFGRGLAYDALGKSVPAGRDFTQAAALDASFAPARARLVAMGLPIPAADPLAAGQPKIDPAAPIALANVPGIEVALGIASDDEGATASLTSRDAEGAAPKGPDGVMASIAETGTSHVEASPSGGGAGGESTGFLRPPSDGLLGDKTEQPAGPAAPEIEIASSDMAASQGSSPSIAVEETPVAAGTAASAAAGNKKAASPAAESAQAAPAPSDVPSDVIDPKAAPEAQKTAELAVPGAEALKPAIPTADESDKRIADEGPEAVKAAPLVAASPEAAGRFYIQIASFQQKALAEKGLLAFGGKFPEIAGQVPPRIVEADLGAKGVVFRLRLGPLETAADSASLCQTLKKQGQDCIVVPPSRNKAG